MPTRHHPLAEYLLKGVTRLPGCQYRRHDRTYLTSLMTEASLMQYQRSVGGEVLDVGCRLRPYERTLFFSAQRYIGLDYLSDRSKPDVVGSALDLPFADQSSDTVVCTEVLEHAPNPLRALQEMRRVLKISGTLVLTTPMYWPRHEVPNDFFRYPYDGLLYLIGESGFELVRLFSRGPSYVFLGQVIQRALAVFVRSKLLISLMNTFFLWCDRDHAYDAVTLGWTVVARRNA